MVNETVAKSSATASSNSNSGTPIEATTGLAEVRGALTAENWEYRFEIKESGVNTWPAATKRTIEVYGDGSLTATLYVTNGTADAANVEGVAVKVDLGGSSIADNICCVCSACSMATLLTCWVWVKISLMSPSMDSISVDSVLRRQTSASPLGVGSPDIF